jgi:ankyrin repeat protein
MEFNHAFVIDHLVNHNPNEFQQLLVGKDRLGWSPLHRGVAHNSIESIQFILNLCKSSPTEKSLKLTEESLLLQQTLLGHSLLHVAVLHIQAQCFKLLSDAYPKLLQLKDRYGRTAVELAESNNIPTDHPGFFSDDMPVDIKRLGYSTGIVTNEVTTFFIGSIF